MMSSSEESNQKHPRLMPLMMQSNEFTLHNHQHKTAAFSTNLRASQTSTSVFKFPSPREPQN